MKVKDSGAREQFATGSQRDTQAGKGRYDLLPMFAIQELAKLYEAGAAKYGEHNWRKGQPVSRYLSSALRHLMRAGEGWTDEPHYVQAMWNIAAILETREAIRRGLLPPELDDVPDYKTSPTGDTHGTAASIPRPKEPGDGTYNG